MADKYERNLGCFIVAILFAIVILQPYFEARSFNKFSKTKATYWDAVITTLRVIPD